MKVDITKLPVLALVMGFFIVVLAVTFLGAFASTRSDDEEEGAPTASETPAPSGNGNGLAVTLEDNSFNPDALTVPAGQSVTINITNAGAAIHNMRIAGADNEFDSADDAESDPQIVPGGQDAVITWDSPAEPGEIDFRCDFHPTEMTGTITVQ